MAGNDAPGSSTAAATLNDWRFHDTHVQTNTLDATAITAESTLIAGGPPMLEQFRESDNTAWINDVHAGIQAPETQTIDEDGNPISNNSPIYTTTSDVVFPIGLLETFSLNQAKQVQRVFEIGSARSYFIPGRTVQGLNFGRIFFNGPSLLRCLYAVYKDRDPGGSSIASGYESMTQAVSIPYHAEQNPGFGHFLINLQSDLFNQHFGIGCFFKDVKGRWYGAFYCEMAMVQSHNLSISAGSTLLVEGASAQFDTVRPIDITGVSRPSDFLVSTPPAFEVTSTAP